MAGRSKIFSSLQFWFLLGFSLQIRACLSGKDVYIGSNMCHVDVGRHRLDNHWISQLILPILYRHNIRHFGSVWKARVRYRKSRVNYYSNSDASFNFEYLLMCGDVCPNPGPSSSLFDALHVVRDNEKQGVSVGHSNVRGLRKNLPEVKMLIEHTNLDILTISETHLTQDIYFYNFFFFIFL